MNIYTYIYTYLKMRNNFSLQKDVHQFTDHFASLEMSVRIDFHG